MAPILQSLSTFLILFTLIFSSCSAPEKRAARLAPSQPTPSDVFDAYLSSHVPVADGFDFAVGDENGGGQYVDKATGRGFEGWYVAVHFAESYSLGIHTGEDWNGNGGGNTDLGQDVHAVANGRVVSAEHCGRLWGNVIIIEHYFYENNERRKILSLYAHLLEIKVTSGEDIRRRQVIATIGQDPEKLFSPICIWNYAGTKHWPRPTGLHQTAKTRHGSDSITLRRLNSSIIIGHCLLRNMSPIWYL